MAFDELPPGVQRPCAPPSTPPSLALAWAQRYLPDYFTDVPAIFHAELLGALENSRQRLIARVAPRGHAKSTCAALAFPLWCICTRRKRNVVIVTQALSLARQFVTDIRAELEHNPRIVEAYGALCGAGSRAAAAGAADGEHPTAAPTARTRLKSAAAHFATVTGITVQARATGTGFRGLRVGPHRPDLIICDDLEKDTLVARAENRRRLERWLVRVVLPALAPHGQLLVLGTLLHRDALLANLADPQRFPHWDHRVYRAVEALTLPDGTFRRVALWPARWPLERLDQERERIGTVAFEQEYQANPLDDQTRFFRPEMLQRYQESELVPEHLVNLVAVDPATGETAGDWFALWVGSVDMTDGRIYTRTLNLERISMPAQIDRILAAYRQWRPVRVGIESNAYQMSLVYSVEERSRREGLYLPVVPMHTRHCKLGRVAALVPFLENGMFRLPPVLDAEAERQFLEFPGQHDDAPDVCAMGLELACGLCKGARVEMQVRPGIVPGRDEW